jgi:hypothetical protein
VVPVSDVVSAATSVATALAVVMVEVKVLAAAAASTVDSLDELPAASALHVDQLSIWHATANSDEVAAVAATIPTLAAVAVVVVVTM